MAVTEPTTRARSQRSVTLTRRVFGRPEAASLIGLIAVYVVFAVAAGGRGFLSDLGFANVLNVAAQFGIVGATVTLLLIAGEFDLSVGSIVGFSSVFYAVSLSHGWPVWQAALVTVAIALGFGAINGYLVVRTGMPSFIVTLAALFTIRGLAIGFAYYVGGSPQSGGLLPVIRADSLSWLFSATIVGNFRVSIIWWIAFSLVAWYVLTRTWFGNWIFATGGSNLAAREVGVPIKRVKISLFMLTALSAGILAIVQVTEVGGADGLRGTGKEFEAAITAVIGGTLLYGGYGSPIGTMLGALTLSVVQQGLFFVGVQPALYQFVLGFILLGAVSINNFVLKNAMGSRR